MRLFQRTNTYAKLGSVKDKKTSWTRKKLFFILALILLTVAGIGIGRFSLTFQQIGAENPDLSLHLYDDEKGFSPYEDPDRINILFLGIRGVEDSEGGLLTDAMVVASIQRSTGRAALISIPRDLWVRMPGKPTYDKINAAYALGYIEGGNGAALQYATASAERVTGLKIDGAVSVNLALVRDFIDAIGGITVTLERPFYEDRQWVRGGDMGTSSAFYIHKDTTSSTETVVVDGTPTTIETIIESERWVFGLPKGIQVLDGTTALYYLRARYTSTDFDRARREQQVLLAVRDKVRSLGILLNPLKLNNILKTFERHVATNISVSEIPELTSLASQVEAKELRHIVLGTSEGELLYAKRSEGGLYILSPIGDNFSAVRAACRDVFIAAAPQK